MKYPLAILLSTIVFFNSCKDAEKLTQFEMTYAETLVVPSSSGINLPFNLFAPDVETNAESTFAVNDTRKDLIEKILLTKLSLRLTSPSNSDFSFLKSIEVYLAADGLSEIKIAWKDDVPSNGDNYLVLETSMSDLKEYIKKESFTLRVNTVTDEILTSDHHIDIESTFFVDAKILGI